MVQLARETALSATLTLLGTEIAPDVTLTSAGLDSIAATAFTRMLSEALSMQLPETLLFDYPTIDCVLQYV